MSLRLVCISSIPLLSRSIVVFFLRDVNFSAGCGPGGIPKGKVRMYICRQHMYLPPNIIYNKNLFEGIFPDMRNLAWIIPFHKRGNNTQAENYRHISIFSSFCKIFERFIKGCLSSHLSYFIMKDQYGIKLGHLTVTSSLEFINFTTNSLNTRNNAHTSFTDFTKTFDSNFDRMDFQEVLSPS